MATETEARVRAVLSYISPNCDRYTWAEVICPGIKNALGDAGSGAWHDWSSQGDSYNQSEAEAVWRSWSAMGKRTFASVVAIAKQDGYKPGKYVPPTPEQRAALDAKAREAAKVQAIEKQAKADKARKECQEIWAEAEGREATGDHPYLKKKGIEPHGTRTLAKWTRRFKKDGVWHSEEHENVLLVPILDLKGVLHGLQYITEQGDKFHHHGIAKQGHFSPIKGTGEVKGYVLEEGFATGASTNETIGRSVLVCFDASNIMEVARQLHEAGQSDMTTIGADNDTKSEAEGKGNRGMCVAFEAGHLFNMKVAFPPTGGDFNDLVVQAREKGQPKEVIDAVVQGLFDDAKVPKGPYLPSLAQAVVAPTQAKGEGRATKATARAPVLTAVASASKEACEAEPGDAVEELNQQHALTMVGDKVVVLRETIGERGDKELLYLSISAFKAWYSNQSVPVETTNGEGAKTTKYHQKADLWIKSPKRRQFEGVTFAPGGNAPASHYNLWAGYAVEPLDCSLLWAAMKCRRLLSHMKYNLCGGNCAHFRYLLAWAADMLQSPDSKKGVALVMRGKKGTGKSTFADALKFLLGRHAIKVAHMRHLTGNFNRHLADKLLIVAEESFWAGDKGDEGPLKDMITSPTLTVEAKGIDAVEMRSLCRVMMITNNDWAVPASTDERRYFVLDVGDRRRQDFKYFAAIEDQLAGGGLRALLTLLLNLPLGAVNLRAVPETGALRKQRSLSLDPHDQFAYDAIADGVLLGREWIGEIEVEKDALYDDYIESARKRGKMHLLTKAVFAKKFMGATGAKATRLRKGVMRVQAYRMHCRKDAAEVFAAQLGVDVEFSDDGPVGGPF